MTSAPPILPLAPRMVEAIWGGRALVADYGKPGAPEAAFGESWECWDDDRVAAGPLAGRTLAELREELGAALLGPLPPARVFPILTKFIDAHAALSVQVHPNDAYAQRVERQPFGKTECWHVLAAEPGAELVLGWTRDTSRGEYLERVAAGTLDELLRRVPVRPGESFYLPSGTLHAIGAGILLYETQQTSDLTYRIYDYGRLGPDGKPRALHVEKAADVLDYRASTAGALGSLAYELDGLRRVALVADPNFVLERIEAGSAAAGLDLEGMPLVITALDHPLELETRGQVTTLAPYATALVPAAIDVVMVRSPRAETAEALTSAPPHDREALARRFSRAGVPDDGSDFLAQF
jgi:mannose-6-phosphate isomerase